MAAFEKPINEYDFKEGDKPDVLREDEQYMYKALAFKTKPKKVEKKDGEFEGDDTDPEMEAFADQEIRA